TDSAERVRIEERLGTAAPTSRFVAVMTEKDVSVALELSRSGDRWSARKAIEVPRLYKAFPLVATGDFCLPFVINTEKFDPREDRDTVVLNPYRDSTNENMTLLEVASDLAARMPLLAAQSGWVAVPTLAKVGPVRAWEWANGDWLRQLLADRVIAPV